MPVTEFARLALKKELDEDQEADAKRVLARAQKLSEIFTGNDFTSSRKSRTQTTYISLPSGRQ